LRRYTSRRLWSWSRPGLVDTANQLTQQRLDGLALVGGQLLPGQAGAAVVTEQVGGRATRHKVAMQDRLHPVLRMRPLPAV
jgi:hypothetical protein